MREYADDCWKPSLRGIKLQKIRSKELLLCKMNLFHQVSDLVRVLTVCYLIMFTVRVC